MKTFMLWLGGSSYSCGGYDDIEKFESLEACKQEFKDRLHDRYYPCVEHDTAENGGPVGWLWFHHKPDDNDDLYPDRVIEFGPRGGLNIYPA
jgi:hypothetical protein